MRFHRDFALNSYISNRAKYHIKSNISRKNVKDFNKRILHKLILVDE